MSDDNRAKFDRIIRPRLEDGYRLALWLTGNRTDAEDVMQEACLKAFLAMERLVEDNVRAWFLTVVRNTCYSWIGRNRPGINLSADWLMAEDREVLERGGAAAPPQLTSEDMLIAKDQADQLAGLIDGLPVGIREVLVLREYHDLSYREISDVAGIPIGTVMSRLARGRKHLLNAIGRAGNDA